MVTTMVMSTNSTSGGKSKKPAVKVNQDMINFIKNQGMTAALKRAGEIKAKGTKGEAEFLEGVKRMYGASRLDAATAKASGSSKSKSYGSNNKPAYRPATSSSVAKPGMPGKGPAARMSEKAATKRKSTTTDPFAKAVLGGLGALGRTLSVEPRVTAAEAKKRQQAKKNK